MRNLASIQKIIELNPIPNADAIEVATVLGWKVVVKKGEFKVGDLCVYCEIDSILPALPEFEFLAPKYRIRTVRLRGQVSQGICFPISIISKVAESNPDIKNSFVETEEEMLGLDVTEVMKITKYEPAIPAQLSGKVRGTFPLFIPKTDETRIQTYPNTLTKYEDVDFYATEKLDGSSATFFVDEEGSLHCCSRNMDLLEDPNNTLWKVAIADGLKEKLADTGYALQGELVGEGIQGNKLNIKGHRVIFFNLYDMKTGKYLDFRDLMHFCDRNNLSVVPQVHTSTKLKKTVDEMVAMATIKSAINPNAWAEGLVFRPVNEMWDDDLGRLSFKVINPEFLLEYKE